MMRGRSADRDQTKCSSTPTRWNTLKLGSLTMKSMKVLQQSKNALVSVSFIALISGVATGEFAG